MRHKAPSHRRKFVITTVAVAALGATLLVAPTANAADKTDFYVVGTSDVSDSNLMSAVIEPGFEAAYPQYDLHYAGSASGAAIAAAESGSGNASALIVHAASLENQFVADGYSTESFGRAIFWGDFVLAGPANDPAGVLNGGTHDIATAFEKIAAEGAANHDVTFVSRGGTAGTTVQEHQIWALTNGVSTCTVPSDTTSGGGNTPSNTGGACATPATSIPYPTWYHVGTATQGQNVDAASACPTSTFPNGGCYVFTDRGTLNYKQSQGLDTNLKIVTRTNDDAARGGVAALTNSFHAYAINPAKFASSPNVHLNPAAAADFLTWITSAGAQATIGNYLNSTSDAPFLPAAAPKLTASVLPATVAGGKPFTVTGSLANVIPGTPALAGKTVTLNASGVPVASTTTDAAGGFSISYTPSTTQYYSVSTAQITQVEKASLTPVFADLLQPTSVALPLVTVVKPKTTTTISKIKVSKSYSALITVKVSPKAVATGGTIKLYGRNSDTKSAGLHLLKTVTVKPGATSVKIRYSLGHKKHSWKKRTVKLKVVYSGTYVLKDTSPTKTVKLR